MNNIVVKEVIDKTNVAFVYYREKDLRAFKEKSGSLALSNEYQCHYDALMITEHFGDGSKCYHIFPLVYYNYPQTVSSASVDFDMKDAIEVATALDSLTKKKYKELRDKLEKYVDNSRNEMTFTLTRYNNVHKHP